jgi:hypothetical protein
MNTGVARPLPDFSIEIDSYGILEVVDFKLAQQRIDKLDGITMKVLPDVPVEFDFTFE